MVACSECRIRNKPCSLEKNPKKPKCMACVRRRTPCVLTDSPTTRSTHKVQKRTGNGQGRGGNTLTQAPPINSVGDLCPRNPCGINKVIIAIDAGTAYMKSAFKVVESREKINPKFIETQIGYEWWEDQVTGELVYRQLWGKEVTIALDEGRINSDFVFRWLKPAIYTEGTRRAAQQRIEHQIDKLPQAIQFSASDELRPGDTRRLTFLDIFSDFMGHAWRYILRKIKGQYPELPWPDPSDVEAYRHFDPCEYTAVETVLPMPADSKPHHVELAIRAAVRAKIPRPQPVAEPAAAYAFDIQRRTDAHGPLDKSGCTIAVDVGGGSVDCQAYSSAQLSPLVVREEVEGADEWCGGNRVNETCRAIVRERCQPMMPRILDALRAHGRSMDENQFLNEIEALFENKKRWWSPGETLSLNIPGLPEIPVIGLRRNTLDLSAEDVTNAFDSSITPITCMIDKMIEKFHTRHPLSRDGSGARISEILLVGGGSSSPFLKAKLRNRYCRPKNEATPYPITVRETDKDGMGAATCISQGAVLLRMDSCFVTERVIRRGYCVKIDEESLPGDRKNPLVKVLRDPHDGYYSRIDVTSFLIRIGERIGHHHQAFGPEGCWRGLFLDEKTETGWVLEEQIFYSDDISEDGLWIDHPRHSSIHPCGMLKVYLTEDDCRFFETRTSPVREREYKYLEYQVQFEIRGIVMTYEIIIPRGGKFVKDGDGGYGINPIRKTAELDASGVFGLFNVDRPRTEI
ncbi:hypothetical protein, variant [Cladophialophora immunda]|uniref:Zn(2)-C6 fungal-type domain-containing protein n=1 Tax=Cladophialophora immunda TaxID=569365 RepID=A0A0D2C5E9_9EURO|nr:hypothetical protein, variant [Cladophialophora immunda]KIW25705.1 hypothetical protein, variant [Cladophialophora immunda]